MRVHPYLSNKKKYKFLENVPKWYSYDPKPLLQNDSAKILWNLPGQTNRRINPDKPDILVLEKNTRTISIIGIAIPNDANISRKKERQDHKCHKSCNRAKEAKTAL